MQMKLLCFSKTFPWSEHIQRLRYAPLHLYLFSKVMLSDLFLKQSKEVEFHYLHISLKMNLFVLNLRVLHDTTSLTELAKKTSVGYSKNLHTSWL